MPTETIETEPRTCRGWTEPCGNPVEDGDLCPDCTMGRLDAQSPRIPL
ncbi:hypothetical protein ACGF7W_34845 [Streptomyces sp. NPDC048219]